MLDFPRVRISWDRGYGIYCVLVGTFCPVYGLIRIRSWFLSRMYGSVIYWASLSQWAVFCVLPVGVFAGYHPVLCLLYFEGFDNFPALLVCIGRFFWVLPAICNTPASYNSLWYLLMVLWAMRNCICICLLVKVYCFSCCRNCFSCSA